MTPSQYAANGYARFAAAIDLAVAQGALEWVIRNRTRNDIAQTRDAFDKSNTLPIKARGLWSADSDYWGGFLTGSGVLPLVRHYLGDRFLLIRLATFIKYPMTRSKVGWHCDADLWGHECDAGLTAWIPLTGASVDSGCLEFIPGSHLCPHGEPRWDLSHPYHKVVDVSGMARPVQVGAEIGDCIVMDKRALHASGPNTTQNERIGLVLAFALCARDVLTEPAVDIAFDGSFELAPC